MQTNGLTDHGGAAFPVSVGPNDQAGNIGITFADLVAKEVAPGLLDRGNLEEVAVGAYEVADAIIGEKRRREAMGFDSRHLLKMALELVVLLDGIDPCPACGKIGGGHELRCRFYLWRMELLEMGKRAGAVELVHEQKETAK